MRLCKYYGINRRILNSSLASAFGGTLPGSCRGYPSQPAFTCSKLTKETLEQSVKYVQLLKTGAVKSWCHHC